MDGEARANGAARPHGSGQVQRREPAGPQGHRHQEPRLGRRLRFRAGPAARARRGAEQRAATLRHAGTSMIYSRISGTGSYLPARVMENAEFAQRLDTSDAWIRERTGIARRHIAEDSQASSDLALHASRNALAAAGVKAEEIDLIVVATSTPDYIFPSTACQLQAKLGVKGCAAFDVQAVCTGFIYGLSTADNFIRTG